MTAGSYRVVAIILTAVGLNGCIDARSQYAPYEGYVSPPPLQPMRRPQYPVSEEAAPARADQAAPSAADGSYGSSPRAAPTNGVQAQGLPPVGDAPRRDSMRYDIGRSAYLIPLVWRPGSDQPLFIDVARHHRLRPEIDATSSSKHRRHAHDEEAPPAQSVTVQKGDTINSIARRFHTTPKVIMEANRDSHPKRLKIGDELQVPTPNAAPSTAKDRDGRDTADTDTPAHGRRHRGAASDNTADQPARDTKHDRRAKSRKPRGYAVKHGDTLYSIAKRNGATVDELKTLNHLRSSSLHSGQKLKLPGDVEAPVAEERPARVTRPAPARRTPQPSRQESLFGSSFGTPPAAPTEPTPAPVATPQSSAGPSHPIPYSSLPGALPQGRPPAYLLRPSVSYSPPAPSYSPPARAAPVPAAPVSDVPATGPTDVQVAAAGKGRFIWPTTGTLLTGFGPMVGGQRNDGLDIASADGSAVRASAAGDVVYAGNLVPGFGNLVLIKHEDGWVTAYAHLSNTAVKIRDHVAQGAEIGTVGSSGGVSQPQLHFEVRYAPSPRERARPIDPTLVLPVGP
jgi:murein DD-endopeptidase MepM/ murein hydrolase activator NlpD